MPPRSDSDFATQQRAQDLDAIMQEAPAIVPPRHDQVSLDALLQDQSAEWIFSKDGANGAMLVKSDVEATGGAALKVESADTSGQVNKTSQMMETFFQNAQGQAPFAAPRVLTYTPEDLKNRPEIATALKARLEALKNDPSVSDKKRVEDQIGRLKNVSEGKACVVKMEFAQGDQINKIPLEDRLAMYKTDGFAQNLGRAMPTFIAMGMNDHLGVEATFFKNNAANLMFDRQTGQLSAIDYSTNLNFHPERPNDASAISFGERGGREAIGAVDNFVKNALKDQESFEKAIEKTVNSQGSPLGPLMAAFTQPQEEIHMFDMHEARQVDRALTLEDKRRFAANLILGSVQGLDYLKSNQQALRTATLSTHEEVNGVKLQHIHTETDLNKLCERLQRIDTEKMNVQIGARMTEFNLASMEIQAGEIAQEKNRLKAKLDRLENHPTLGDRFKFLVNGKDKVIGEVKQQKAEVDTRSQEFQKASTMLINAKTEADNLIKQLDQQRAGLEQPVKLRDNAAIADIAAHHPGHGHDHDQGHEQAPEGENDLAEAPHKLRDDKAIAKPAEPKPNLPEDERMEVKTPKPNIAKKV